MTPSQLFAAVKALFESKELQALLMPLANAASNVANNPTGINVLLQLDMFFGALIAAQPGIVQSELQLIAADLSAAAAAVSSGITAKAAAAVAAAAPPAPAA
jgi:hypothetical protein